jgi:protein tyrosine phosphatase (PTP) superfamily phosphohydrolase (DUF442 family)
MNRQLCKRRSVRRAAAVLAVAAVFLAAGPAGAPGEEPPAAETPAPIEIPGVENAFRLSPRLYSGGDPGAAGALEALKELGVRTIVSVDGAAPDVEAARALGIRYVHLPIGYDGVPRDQAVRLARVVRDLPGPVYVHCHHGKHRGPAAAAVCAVASEGWSAGEAVAWMERAGASRDYGGLYESVGRFVPPTPEDLEKSGDLPERAEVPALVDLMVRLDGRWDRLKAARASGFRAVPDAPDGDPAHEALQVLELLREAARLHDARFEEETFRRDLADAERRAADLHEALKARPSPAEPGRPDPAEAAFAAVAKSCTGCHARSRDR